jgi:uroporphyrin-III C-methyltransferase / precorrin-2 dehydrogenase / sirohydrochlorin ferrochelatase
MGSGLPVTLIKLDARLCIVVGGGAVAERKARALLAAAARVRVVAPTLTDGLSELAQTGAIEWLARAYCAGDLATTFLVIAATDDAQVNHAVAREANERGCLINVVDDPAYCNFITPAVVRRGDLTIAVCSGGEAPALAGHLRAQLEQQFGPEWAEYVARLAQVRQHIAARYPDVNLRRQVWQRLLEADLERLLTGDEASALARIEQRVEESWSEMSPGKVYLVGAGPGDPGLITVRGLDLLRRAQVVVYDRLVDPDLLCEARRDAELVYVGKATNHHTLPQEDINALLIEHARRGKMVVRLKGGDPFVFGRGGEEALALVAAGIPFEVIPGVTSAIAVPAGAGIPVTHREVASSFTVVTGHEDTKRTETGVDWATIACGKGTLVFLMGVTNLPTIVKELVENGRPLDTPAAIIERGTTAQQRVVVGTLADIHERALAAHIQPPAITVVGEVVALREKILLRNESCVKSIA